MTSPIVTFSLMRDLEEKSAQRKEAKEPRPLITACTLFAQAVSDPRNMSNLQDDRAAVNRLSSLLNACKQEQAKEKKFKP